MYNFSKWLVILMLLAFSGCRQVPPDVREVDFSDPFVPGQKVQDGPDRRPIRAAVSAILSPKETFHSYEEIFQYISGELDMPIEFQQRRTYQEVNDLLESGEIDFAFICSGAYIGLDPAKQVELMVVPVSHGEPLYQAYIIVPENSSANSLYDLRGKRFAYTDPISNTGHLYALYRLYESDHDPASFFGSTMFTHGHDVSIQMVGRGLVDGATIDGLVYDYLAEKEPSRVAGIRIIEKSAYFGIPPIVSSSRLDEDLRQRIKDLFLHMHLDPEGASLINSLLIDKFVEGKDSDYNSIRHMKAVLEEN